MHRSHKNQRELPHYQKRRRNELVAPVWALVEKVVGSLKGSYRYRCFGYYGLGRNAMQMWFKRMVYNLRKAVNASGLLGLKPHGGGNAAGTGSHKEAKGMTKTPLAGAKSPFPSRKLHAEGPAKVIQGFSVGEGEEISRGLSPQMGINMPTPKEAINLNLKS